MKILAIYHDLNSIEPQQRLVIGRGRFYHFNRLIIVERNSKCIIACMNIFERAIAVLAEMLGIDFKGYLAAKQLKVVQHSIPSSRPVGSLPSASQRSPAFHSFEDYQKQREQRGEPVDLIVGRGRNASSSYPRLVDQRDDPEKDAKASYNPFTVDINADAQPDAAVSVADPEAMKRLFPTASVNEVYLERLPLRVLSEIKTYCNIARILKVGGYLVGDFNDGVHPASEREEKVILLNQLFIKYDIPLAPAPINAMSLKRSDLNVHFTKFAFVKIADFTPSLDPKKLLRVQDELTKIKFVYYSPVSWS